MYPDMRYFGLIPRVSLLQPNATECWRFAVQWLEEADFYTRCNAVLNDPEVAAHAARCQAQAIGWASR